MAACTGRVARRLTLLSGALLFMFTMADDVVVTRNLTRDGAEVTIVFMQAKIIAYRKGSVVEIRDSVGVTTLMDEDLFLKMLSYGNYLFFPPPESNRRYRVNGYDDVLQGMGFSPSRNRTKKGCKSRSRRSKGYTVTPRRWNASNEDNLAAIIDVEEVLGSDVVSQLEKRINGLPGVACPGMWSVVRQDDAPPGHTRLKVYRVLPPVGATVNVSMTIYEKMLAENRELKRSRAHALHVRRHG